MRRVATILFVVIMTVSLIAAPPASAANVASPGLTVASEHTDENELDGVLTNASIEGTGRSASVVTNQTANWVDNWEDGDAVPLDAAWSGSMPADSYNPIAGSYSGNHTCSGGGTVCNERLQRSKPAKPDSIELLFRVNSPAFTSNDGHRILVMNGSASSLLSKVNFKGNNSILIDGVDSGTWSKDTVYRVRYYNIDYANNQLDVEVVRTSDDTVVASATDTSDGSTFDALDKVQVELWADDSSADLHISVDNVDSSLTDGDMVGDAQYNSRKHDNVDAIEEAWINLSATNASLEVKWQGYDGNSYQDIDTSTYTSDGNYTIPVSTNYEHYIVSVSISNDAGNSSAAIHDEGVLFDPRPPDIDNSTASPTGTLTSRPSQLSIDVSDFDFSLDQGDSLTIEFFRSKPTQTGYSSVGTDTLASNGTATTSITMDEGGTHDWYVKATDSYGESTLSANFSTTVPATLYLRNETNPSDLVDSPVSVTVRFFGEDEVVERTTDSGTVDLQGLNVSTPFIVSANATRHYTQRVVYLQDIYQQQAVYMLNATESRTVETRFQLEDPTGEFGGESILTISKPINQSGTTEFRDIYADRFGVEGVTVTLEQDRRYRLRVRSVDGVVQDLGPYRADVSETVTVRPGSPTIEVGNYNKGWDYDATLDNRTLTIVYDDPTNSTDSLTIAIYERGNASNLLRPNTTYTNLGRLESQYTLTANESEEQWVVQFEITRNGSTFNVTQIVRNNPDLVIGDLSREWRLITGIAALLIFAGIFSVLNRAVGAIMTALVGGILWWTGWLSGATTGAAVVIYLFVAVGYSIYQSGGP